MKTFLPADLAHRDRHQLLLGGVAPRPIAFVTTVDGSGNVNLAPFSFFNAFASNPPIVAIGPAVAAKTKREKDTWLNILGSSECTISAVSYQMVHSMNIASADYPHGVDEYVHTGFTKKASTIVAPPFVAESPYSMECKLMESIELRRDIGGNGNIVLLEVVAFHVADRVFVDGKIDPRRMDLVGRMGGAWYCRTTDLFQATQPAHHCIGIDALPESIRTSPVLTGNDLARLAYVPMLPVFDDSFPSFDRSFNSDDVDVEILAGNPEAALLIIRQQGKQQDRVVMHKIAQLFLNQDRIEDAWQTLLLE